MASRCSRAELLPSAESQKFPSLRCRGHQPVTLPLARKIASSVGIAEIVLLEKIEGAWMPLSVGDMSLETIARADGWLAVPAASEGFAVGTPVDAYMLRD